MIMTLWKKIGEGIEITMLEDRMGRFVGLLERHVCKNLIETTTMNDAEPTYVDGLTEKSVLFDLPWNNTPEHSGRPKWKVMQWEPLTLTPSILCRQCGLHGWIRDGEWVTDPSATKHKIVPVWTVPVEIRINGEPPIYLGSYESRSDSVNLEADRQALAKLLHAYARQLDPRTIVGFVWHRDGEDVPIPPEEIDIVYP